MTKPNLSTSRVLAAVESIMGPVSGLTHIRGGLESETYRTLGAPHIIVRINPSRAGFQKDALAFRLFGSAELPIPKVHHIGDLDGYAFCISEEAPGVTLEDVDESGLPILLQPTARIMQAIASADIRGISDYGPFDAEGRGMYESWRAFILSVQKGDERREITRVFDRFRGLAECVPELRALVHGDFGSNNVLTDGRGITGVVDWSEAMIGDPLYDVANVFFWRTWLPCMEQQARYFESTMRLDAEKRDRLLCYQLRIGLAEVHSNVLQGRTEMVEWALSRCFDLLP